jgi:small GTP-binding protein
METANLVVLGPGGVGKSCLTIRYVSGEFVAMYDPTVSDSYKKPTEIDGKTVMMDIMDTAGQEELAAMRDQYILEAEAFLLIYAVDARTTFDDAVALRDHVLRLRDGDDHEIPLVLIGNKCDLPEAQRQVTPDEGRAIAKAWGCPFFETSAKESINVAESFEALVREQWRLAPKPAKKSGCSLL